MNIDASDAGGPSRRARPTGVRGAALGLALLATTCRAPEVVGPLGPPDPVVALVDGVAIHASQVAGQMQRRGTADRRGALQDCVDFELLARAAESAAAQIDAADRAAARLASVQRLVERDVEPLLTRQAIPEAEVRALYEKGKPRFVHGRLVEALVMGFFTGARMKPERRAQVEHDARLWKAFLDQHPGLGPAGVEALAKEPLWAERKLSVSKVWQEENQGEPYPMIVGRALASLRSPGSSSPLVVDETGAYVAMYLDEKPPENRAFEEVAPELRDEMFEPWRRQRFLRLVMELASGHEVAVDPEALALLDAEPQR